MGGTMGGEKPPVKGGKGQFCRKSRLASLRTASASCAVILRLMIFNQNRLFGQAGIGADRPVPALAQLLATSRYPMKFTAALFVSSALALAMADGVRAETRMFVVTNQPDGYGVDRCLARGEACGKAAATAFCEARQFVSATAFSRISADEITGSIPAPSRDCAGDACGAYVAITCQR